MLLYYSQGTVVDGQSPDLAFADAIGDLRSGGMGVWQLADHSLRLRAVPPKYLVACLEEYMTDGLEHYPHLLETL